METFRKLKFTDCQENSDNVPRLDANQSIKIVGTISHIFVLGICTHLNPSRPRDGNSWFKNDKLHCEFDGERNLPFTEKVDEID